ncbi:MAG: peptidylprolyl isomerase [Oligoflexales bacterium]|nr:peptidylprolyl isomerase [Oligoflexales bacterium]
MWRWKDKKIDGFDKKQLTKHWSTYVVLFLALGAMTFFGVCDPSGRKYGRGMLSEGTAATVSGEKISALEFRRAYQNAYHQYQQQYKSEFDPSAFNLSGMVLARLVEQKIFALEAARNGFLTTEADVEKFLLEIDVFKDEKGKFSSEKLDNYLKANAFSEKDLMDTVQRDLTIDRFRRFILETYAMSGKALEAAYKLRETKFDLEYINIDDGKYDLSASDEEISKFLNEEGKKKVKEYYDKNQSEFNKEKKVKGRHILIAFKGARGSSGEAGKRTKEEAKALAEKVLLEVKAARGSFPKIAEKYTDDPSGKKNGGDLGFFDEKSMVKEFSDTAFKLKEGEISQVVETPFGFHIIFAEKIQDKVTIPLEAATKQIAGNLIVKDKKPNTIKQVSESILNDLKAGKAIDETLKKYNLKWMSTGPFPVDSRYIPGLGASDDLKRSITELNNNNRLLGRTLIMDEKSYVVRLKSISLPDMGKFDEKKRKELLNETRMMDAYAFFTGITSAMKKNYEDSGKIWENPQYRDMDSQRKKQQAD